MEFRRWWRYCACIQRELQGGYVRVIQGNQYLKRIKSEVLLGARCWGFYVGDFSGDEFGKWRRYFERVERKLGSCRLNVVDVVSGVCCGADFCGGRCGFSFELIDFCTRGFWQWWDFFEKVERVLGI